MYCFCIGTIWLKMVQLVCVESWYFTLFLLCVSYSLDLCLLISFLSVMTERKVNKHLQKGQRNERVIVLCGWGLSSWGAKSDVMRKNKECLKGWNDKWVVSSLNLEYELYRSVSCIRCLTNINYNLMKTKFQISKN